jgi:hypothetical protein
MRIIVIILFLLKVSICFAQIDTTIYFVADTFPQFKYKNGLCTADCLLQYNYDSIRIPQDFECQGNVYLQFVVEKNGTLTNLKLIRLTCKEYDIEAIRLINSMPNWEPGVLNSQKVRMYYVLPVRFMVLYSLDFRNLTEFSIKRSKVFLHEYLSDSSSIFYQNESLYFRNITSLNSNKTFTYTRQNLNDLYFIYGSYNLSNENLLQFQVDTVQTNNYINDFNGKNRDWKYHFGKNLLLENHISLSENRILLESDLSDPITGEKSILKTELIKR